MGTPRAESARALAHSGEDFQFGDVHCRHAEEDGCVFGYEGVDDGAHVEEVGWEDYCAGVREGGEEAEDQAEAVE